MKKIYLSFLLLGLSVAGYSQAPSISVTASTPDTVCAGTPVTYTAVATNTGTSPLYVWSINGVITAGGVNFTYTPHNGDRVKCAIVSNSPTAVPDTASTSLLMTVNPVFAPSVAISTGSGDTLCTGVSTIFTAVPSGGGTAPLYQWYRNYTAVSVASSYTYVPANGDIISCTMVSNYVCRTADTASQTTVMTVSNNITPVVHISTSTGSNTSCIDQVVTFDATQTGGGFNPSYNWTVNGLPAGSGNSYSYVPNNGDLVAVHMTSSFPCVTTPAASTVMGVTVLPVVVPVVAVVSNPGPAVSSAVADTFRCNIISGGGINPVFQWFKGAAPIAGATTNRWVAPAGSLHTNDSIACQVTNTDQCSNVSAFGWQRIIINNNTGVSILGQNAGDISLTPNPSKGSFTVTGTYVNDEPVHMTITDMLGREVYQADHTVINGQLSAAVQLPSGINAGIYIVNLHSAGGNNVVRLAIEK